MARRDIAERIYTQILEVQRAQEQLYEIERTARRSYNDPVAAGEVHSALYEKEARLWRDLGMVGLSLPKKDQERIAAAFYRDKVEGLVEPEWFSQSDESWEKVAVELFAPQVVKDYIQACKTAEVLEKSNS